MKKIITTLMIAAGFISAQAQAPSTTESKADIQFTNESHDFGNIREGTLATYEFKFTNTGTQPLVLTDVNASCGCTKPEWPREPIAPGAGGVVKAIYNSNSRPGSFNKTITVTSNAASSQKILTIKGVVDPVAVSADVALPPVPAKTDNIPEPMPVRAPLPVAAKPTPKSNKAPTKAVKPLKPATKTPVKAQPKS